MALFRVEGGHRLKGELTPQGAKNEALQILSALLLTPHKVVIHNVPDIVDVRKLIELLSSLGVEVKNLGLSKESATGSISHSWEFCAANIDIDFVRTTNFCC